MRFLISGKVQGVFFRASARFEAERLELTGHARNLSDGRVEVLACGEKEAIDQLQVWLTKGPPQAEVSGVSCEPVTHQELADFTIG
ncbi:MAG: acylphosphatase [Sedimenticola sp.]|nr:acylphosphatase [Sedimenticola sp.]